MPGVCYSALRRLPRRDLHPLETGSVKPLTQDSGLLLLHDAPSSYFKSLSHIAPYHSFCSLLASHCKYSWDVLAPFC
jgi:hypothetical protein